MQSIALLKFLLNGIASGQEELADTLRTLIYQRAPDWFALLDFADDSTFLEPTLFQYFTQGTPGMTLAQILYGYCKNQSPRAFPAKSNHAGYVYLPNLGYMYTGESQLALVLNRDESSAELYFEAKNHYYRTPLQPIQRLQAHDIAVTAYFDPLNAVYFTDEGKPFVNLTPTNYLEHYEILSRALTIMKNVHPNFYDSLSLVTRHVILYHNASPRSFATLSAHGNAYLNVGQECHEVFYLDDMAHQCGHIMFNAITWEKLRYFNMDPATPLIELTHDPAETREIYAVFHGLFTYVCIISVLHCCYEQSVFRDHQAHELIGRILFYLVKLRLDLEHLKRRDIFSPAGREFYDIFQACYHEYHEFWREPVRKADFSNQNYVFNYRLFYALNHGNYWGIAPTATAMAG